MQPPSPAPLSVAFDASLWDEPTTGIGLYTHCLAGALEAQGVQLQRLGARVSGEGPRGDAGRSAWVLGRLPQQLRDSTAPLFHALGNFNLPLRKVPGKRYVLTVHDLIPLTMPHSVSTAFRWQFRLWLSRSVGLADRILCNSAHTERELLARYPAARGRTVLTPLGVDHVDAHAAAEPSGDTQRFLRALALPRDFVLYAGSLDVRKNVGLVLDALERLRAAGRPASLVLAGQRWFGSGSAEARIERLRAEGHDIRPLGYQEAPVFYALMRRASVFVFPSRMEGFGLPPLEAMRLGVPTIVSDAGALPEVCADAALAVRPDDAEGLAAALTRLLHSKEERWAWAEKGRARAAQFTWKRTAGCTLEAYRAALALKG
ncbi:MAG TPA: glycosyltransferase family 1 protein [Aggregicoccus sp.]|nr:glycosyltransferase family 1 protein [Aggregicoccus sp.]